jgi:hypothetical protein
MPLPVPHDDARWCPNDTTKGATIVLHTRMIGTLAAAFAVLLPLAATAQGGVAATRQSEPASASRHAAHPPGTLAAHPETAVARARQATRKFHSLATATQRGYGLLRDQDGISCIDMPGMGAMGVHYVNGDFVADPSLHVRRPEAVVYETVHGTPRLVALEYVVLKQDWDAVHGVDAPRPRLYGERFDKTDEPNRYGLPTFYSLHAWVWKHNPAGTFAMWNPDVHCPCDSAMTRHRMAVMHG